MDHHQFAALTSILLLCYCLVWLQEFHISQIYHEGLAKLQAKDYEKARDLLESILKDPLVSNIQVLHIIIYTSLEKHF